jgi:hypothetical protein
MQPANGSLKTSKSIVWMRFYFLRPFNLLTELHIIKRRKANSIGLILRRNSPLKHLFEGKIERMRRGGGRRKQLLGDFKENSLYKNFTEEAPDCTPWRTRFGRGYGPIVLPTAQWMDRPYRVCKHTGHGRDKSAVICNGGRYLDRTTEWSSIRYVGPLCSPTPHLHTIEQPITIALLVNFRFSNRESCPKSKFFILKSWLGIVCVTPWSSKWATRRFQEATGEWRKIWGPQ